MYGSNVSLPSIAAVALVIAAILGYVAGVEAEGTPARKAPPALATSVLLEYPSSWRRAGAAPEIPGLTVAHPSVFAPYGDSANTGLVSGKLPAGEPSPLPAGFLAGLRAPLDSAVVNFAEAQAYRYSRLSVAGFAPALTAYVLPGLGGGPTVLLCYASAAAAASMATCERIVSTLRLVGQAQSYNLTPDPGYAGQIRALLDGLERQRVALRAAMQHTATPATVATTASALAQRFGDAADALSHLEPPLVAGQAQLALSAALTRAGEAYAALATAAQAASLPAYGTARAGVEAAEGDIDRALADFAALAYVRS